jgi:hypothetical protein
MLERYRDGEPVAELRKTIQQHLVRCEACRDRLLRLSDSSIDAQAELKPPGLSKLFDRIREWESTRPAPEVRGPVIRERAAREVELFLGGEAAARLTQPISDDGNNLLPTIGPVLGRFLGKRAASHLSSHIVEVAVVKG